METETGQEFAEINPCIKEVEIMAKHFVAAAFSAAVFLLLPPADLTRAEAWMTVALMYVTGLAIACWAGVTPKQMAAWMYTNKTKVEEALRQLKGAAEVAAACCRKEDRDEE